MERLQQLRRYLDETVEALGGVIIAGKSARIPTITSYAIPDLAGSSQLVQFDLAGIAVSAGSACSSGSMKASPVMAAMGVPDEIGSCFVRVSFGPDTSKEDVDRFVAEWQRIRDRASSRAA